MVVETTQRVLSFLANNRSYFRAGLIQENLSREGSWVKPDAVSKALQSLLKKGLVAKKGRGSHTTWTITGKGTKLAYYGPPTPTFTAMSHPGS